jgi:hypothetical protein
LEPCQPEAIFRFATNFLWLFLYTSAKPALDLSPLLQQQTSQYSSDFEFCTGIPFILHEMDSIKGTISSVTGAGSTQAADGNDSSTTSTSTSTRDLEPTPPETGLQSRGQTEHSGRGSFLGEMKNMVNSAIGAGGTKEEKELAVDRGNAQTPFFSSVARRG